MARLSGEGVRIAGFDGIRAISAVIVMMLHARVPGWAGGGLGVDIFFVLSGFLITSGLAAEWERTGDIGIGRFYVRRLGRLVPALYFMLVVMTAVHLWVFPEHAPRFFVREILPAALYVTNLTLIFFDTPLLTFGHTWSLAVEEHFYLIWPVVLLFALRRSPRAALWTALGIAITAAIWRGLLFDHGVPQAQERWLSESLDTRADELLLGAAAALLSWGAQRRVAMLWPIGLPVVVYMIAAEQNWGTHQAYYGGAFLFSAATAVVLLKIKHSQDWIVTRALSWRPLSALGIVSYAFYLWHAPILVVLVGTTSLTSYALAIVCFVLTTAAATVSWFLIERPAKRLLGSAIGLRRQEAIVPAE